MIFSDFEVDASKGSFKIELDRPCQCYVGLVAFHLPSIDDPDVPHNVVELSCDQIDSEFMNPKRLLKRLVFEKVDEFDHYFNHYDAHHIDFKPIDSQDKFLSFKIERPNHGLSFEAGTTAYITLAFKPFNSDHRRWIRI